MVWDELRNNLEGPDASHFGHIVKMCDGDVEIKMHGVQNAQLSAGARLHVLIESKNESSVRDAPDARRGPGRVASTPREDAGDSRSANSDCSPKRHYDFQYQS